MSKELEASQGNNTARPYLKKKMVILIKIKAILFDSSVSNFISFTKKYNDWLRQNDYNFIYKKKPMQTNIKI